MQKVFIAVLGLFLFLSASDSWAFRSEHFRGWYSLLGSTAAQSDKEMLFDVDTLEQIWKKYAEGELPENLKPHRLEPTVLVAFTFLDIYYLGFERNALVSPSYFALGTNPGERVELQRRADGNFDLAVVEKGVGKVFLMGPPKPRPQPLLSLPSHLQIE